MACGCKNKAAKANTSVTKTSSTQEAKPQKTSNGTRIIRREIR